MAEVENMNIYQKLAKIRKPVEVLKKDKSGYGYKYVTESLILAKITGLMDKYDISLIPNIVPGTTQVVPYSYTKKKVMKSGEMYDEPVNEILVSADMEWHWVNNADPTDRVIVPWTMVGQQSDASQSFGSGLSYSSRYFMLKYFNVATSDDDPDNWRSLQEEAAAEEDKKIAAEVIKETLNHINAYLESHSMDQNERNKIAETVKKYAKSKGKPSENPNAITDSKTASKLFADITKNFPLTTTE